eukprot:6880290-Alexandrium_andersonii.AAC.1
MSASLVGSEMCIRDSPARARNALGVPAPAQGRGRAPQAPPLWEVWGRELCLLYTSDAADDM